MSKVVSVTFVLHENKKTIIITVVFVRLGLHKRRFFEIHKCFPIYYI